MIRTLAFAALVLIVSAGTPSFADGGFSLRGVIEGFYGPPWPAQSRLDFLQWMIDQRMNLYIHAPKNDPWQRLQWRQPYPAAEVDQFAKEIALAGKKGLLWVPSISPAFPLLEAADEHDTDICFSCPDDFQVLIGKLDQFWNVGARALMISFDDVIKISSHPEDAARYGVGDYAYGVMNGELLNAIYEHYAARDSTARLITVPADYFGVSTTPYLEGLSSVLRDEVVVMWTGVLVVSPTISCTEANGYAQAIGRKPLLWDNFPVNDYAPYKLMVGPYEGRAAELPDCLLGIASNPANQVKANRIPLFTVAEYLNDPAGYDPEASWERSLRAIAKNRRRREMLGHFIENVRSTALDRTESVRFTNLSDDFVAALDGADWPGAHEILREELEAERSTPERLRNEYGDAELVGELDCELPLQSAERVCVGSWLDRLALNATNGLAATAALVATRPDVTGTLSNGVLSGRATPPAARDAAMGNVEDLTRRRTDDVGNANVHGDRFYFALGPTYVLENRMDRYLTLAQARASAYLPLSAVASRSVTVEVNGSTVATEPDGSFEVAVEGNEAVVLVTDGAGQRTRRVFRAGDQSG